MGIWTDNAWRWSRGCWDPYTINMNWSELMRIVSKLIGHRLGGICRSTKKASTILPGKASATLSRSKLDQDRPPEADLTTWTNYSISPRPRKLHMSKRKSHSSRNNSSNNCSRNSLRAHLPKAANESLAVYHRASRQHLWG